MKYEIGLLSIWECLWEEIRVVGHFGNRLSVKCQRIRWVDKSFSIRREEINSY